MSQLPVPVAAIAARAPPDWAVLQLACNNVDVERGLLAAGVPFVRWRRHHWGAGAYALSRAGAAVAADPRHVSPALGKLVADEAVFWRPGAYTFTRPLLGDGGFASAIQSHDHTALVQGPSRSFRAAYFGARAKPRDLAAVFGAGDPLVLVAARVTVGVTAAWVTHHLRRGARWLVIYGSGIGAEDAVTWVGREAFVRQRGTNDAADTGEY